MEIVDVGVDIVTEPVKVTLVADSGPLTAKVFVALVNVRLALPFATPASLKIT
jgi:hypothetical protein